MASVTAVGWAVPIYSKSRVRAAGREYIGPESSRETREIALAVINNWRSSHNFPLNTFQVTLRQRARRIEPDPLVAQRIKRLSSIAAKLQRFPAMKLDQMQDIGGCRAVMGDVSAVDKLVDMYKGERSFRHQLVREDDYLRDPKSSGYRGVHLAYRYNSDRSSTYNGLKIEVQIRSYLEHAWATAVETVGTFIQQALKSSQGEEDWLRFFALMGSEIALQEGTPTIPGTPHKRASIRTELYALTQKLDVVRRLQAYGDALHAMEDMQPSGSDHYFLLELNAIERHLTVHRYRSNQLAQAQDAYEAVERAIGGREGCDAVLVSADSLAALRRAYPNYFLDTTEFLKLVRRAARP
jgi:hypothetical protein